jgi:hypothetical protein
MGLSKEVCYRCCKNAYPEVRTDPIQTFYDYDFGQHWLDGFVYCPYKYSKHEIDKNKWWINTAPPDWCPYELEQLVDK